MIVYESIYISPSKSKELYEIPMNILFWLIIMFSNANKWIFSIMYIKQSSYILLICCIIITLLRFSVYSIRNYFDFIKKFTNILVKIVMLLLLIVESSFEFPVIWVYLGYIYHYSNYRFIYDKNTFSLLNSIIQIAESFITIILYITYDNSDPERSYFLIPLLSFIFGLIVIGINVFLILMRIKIYLKYNEEKANIDKLEIKKIEVQEKKDSINKRHGHIPSDRAQLIKKINTNSNVEDVINTINSRNSILNYNSKANHLGLGVINENAPTDRSNKVFLNIN
jgi:hypothetical protein